MDQQRLAEALQKSWSAETSANPNWHDENPSLGQCAVTACVVQDFLGGEIVNATAQLPDGSTDSHYFNVIDGAEVDLTRQQFPKDTVIPEGQEKKKDFSSTREYVLSYEPTKQRYDTLKKSVLNFFMSKSLNEQ